MGSGGGLFDFVNIASLDIQTTLIMFFILLSLSLSHEIWNSELIYCDANIMILYATGQLGFYFRSTTLSLLGYLALNNLVDLSASIHGKMLKTNIR